MRRLSHRQRLPLACLLAALLLLAQGLGLAHRVAHGGGATTVHKVAWGAGHDAGDAVCQLVDQLAHADALCDAGALAALPLLPQQTPAAAPPRAHAARHAGVYLARGPPAA